MSNSRQQLASDLTIALKALPASLRPKQADIGAMAQIMADHPALAKWGVVGKALDWRDLEPR